MMILNSIKSIYEIKFNEIKKNKKWYSIQWKEIKSNVN